jgi:hypothetical protein
MQSRCDNLTRDTLEALAPDRRRWLLALLLAPYSLLIFCFILKDSPIDWEY